MTLRQSKLSCFVLEGLHSFATSFYFYYLFFYMKRQFGFGNLGNLSLAALNGFVYMLFAWYGGKFGQRFGYVTALRAGITIISGALIFGGLSSSVSSEIIAMVVWTFGLCFTWPTLEALASEKEDPVGLQRAIGIYNLVWAASSALSYFSGGFLLETFGVRSLFWIPLGIHVCQFGLIAWLKKEQRAAPRPAPEPCRSVRLNPRPIARARTFLRMSWWSNPFAYVAINTVAAVVPGLAQKLGLSPMFAGFCCSVWFFARLGSFLVLWLWTGWQYRFRWFIGAYVLLGVSFATILLVPRLAWMIAAQVGFGLAIGLLYYSSLYYSMDAGDTKGEHGGFHESAIGAGLCGGPALGAAALFFLPAQPNSGVWAVSMALCAGFFGLLWIVRQGRQRPAGRIT